MLTVWFRVKAIVDDFESQSSSKGKDEAAVASKKRKGEFSVLEFLLRRWCRWSLRLG